MCRSFRLLANSDTLPLEVFIRQARRYFITDFILSIVYLLNAIFKTVASVVYLASACSALYFIDALMMFYITGPSRALTLTPGHFHANTAVNVVTLVVNIVYVVLELSVDRSVFYLLLSLFSILYKAAKVMTLHKLAVRFTAEAGIVGLPAGNYDTAYVPMDGSKV
mmetsp:Transcript_42637/g.86201  ORF Transcript_42637/g.86201 Transcript_42637/m.86201 type:complete len:166 (+) Transcript_42637:92-589(+)